MKTLIRRRTSLGILVALLSLALLPFIASAAGPWDVSGDYVVSFVLGDTYNHDMTLLQSGANITGVAGGYPAGGTHVYAWTIDSGTVSGDTITLTAHYTLGAVGTTMHMTGTIAPDGSMSGVWDDDFGGIRNGSWSTISGSAHEGDFDHDGVLDGTDKCLSTTVDTFALWNDKKATNRWMWNGTAWVKKGSYTTQDGFAPTLADTYGCSGTQILDAMKAATGLSFEGHYKFGLSKSIIEDWMRGTYYMGPTFVETIEVPAASETGVASTHTLTLGTQYFLKAYGTAFAGDGIEFDADYSFRTGSSIDWTDAVSTYESYGDSLLDLLVDTTSQNWGAYASNHTYQIPYTGTGNTLALKVNDVYAPNNIGSLFVDLIEDKWVTLW